MNLPAGFVPDSAAAAMPAGFTPDAPAAQPIQSAAPEAPGGAESVGRGLLQGVTLGFSDEIGGAIGSLFSDKKYEQVRDEIRAGNKAASEAHPWLYGAGEVGGGVATAFIPGLNIAKGASLAKTAASLGAQGAAAGFGGSEATTAGGLARDTAIGGALGVGIGAVGHGVGSLLTSAPGKAIADRAANVAQGEGLSGAASAATKKALARDTEGVDKALTTAFKAEGEKKPITLASIMRDPAKDVLPVVDERLQQIGSKLDPIYTRFDKAEGGGMSLHHMINSIDDEVATLRKTPLHEKWINALEDVKESAVKAWAPELADQLRANKIVSEAGLSTRAFKNMQDVKVPFADVRSMVSQLQARGSKSLDTLHPSEAMRVKADVATTMRDLLNNTIEAAADNHPNLAKDAATLFETNRMFSATSRIRDAVEERLAKENAGQVSAKGHLAHAIGAAVGGVAGGAIPIPIVGHAAGAALGSAVAGKAQAGLGGARQAATAQLAGATQKLNQLALRAQSGDATAIAILHAVQNSPDVMAKLAGLHSQVHGSEQ